MKRLFSLIVGSIITLSSCSRIPDKPVFEQLSTAELSMAIKSDTSFAGFYERLIEEVGETDDITKAKFNDVTYRRLFKYFKFIQDTTYWKPLSRKWEKEWNEDFGSYLPKSDSILNYWRNYMEENSLNNYVRIELAQIDKEYYEYIGGLKDINIGFRLVPLKGEIEQLRFNYGYKAKISSDSKYYEKTNCIITTPFSSPTIKYWEVSYSDRDKFEGETAATFLRDYNVYIEITNIRKNGINMSTSDFAIPGEVSNCLENENTNSALFEFSRTDLIKKLMKTDYMSKWEYLSKKANEIREREDKLCFDFLQNQE